MGPIAGEISYILPTDKEADQQQREPQQEQIDSQLSKKIQPAGLDTRRINTHLESLNTKRRAQNSEALLVQIHEILLLFFKKNDCIICCFPIHAT
jgi:hypothetical protein